MLTLAKNKGVDKWWYEIINLDTHSVMDKTPLSFNIAVDKYQVKKEIWLNCIEAQWILMFLFRLPLNLVINNSNLKNNEWRILYHKKCCYLTIVFYSCIYYFDILLKTNVFCLRKQLLLFLINTSWSFSLSGSKSHVFDLLCYIFACFIAFQF